MSNSDKVCIPHQQHACLDVGVFCPDCLRRMPRVVREHIDLLVTQPLKALDVEVTLPGEHVDPVASEFTNADVDEQRVAVLDRRRH